MSRPTGPVSEESTMDSLDFDVEKHESSADSLLAEDSFQSSKHRHKQQQRALWINFGCTLLVCCVLSFAAGHWIDSLDLKARCFAMDTIYCTLLLLLLGFQTDKFSTREKCSETRIQTRSFQWHVELGLAIHR
jgi:hypothetical protein